MGKYRASFRYDIGAGITGHQTATVTVDGTDEYDAARKIEAAMQGLVDRAVTLSEPVSHAPVERGRGTLGWAPGVTSYPGPLPPSRDEFVRALANVVEAYDRAFSYACWSASFDRNPVGAAHVEEARKLLDAVLPKKEGGE